MRHGAAIQASGAGAGSALPALRSLAKALTRLHEDLAFTCEANLYGLQYICAAAAAGGGADVVEEGEQRQNRHAGGGSSSSEEESEED